MLALLEGTGTEGTPQWVPQSSVYNYNCVFNRNSKK